MSDLTVHFNAEMRSLVLCCEGRKYVIDMDVLGLSVRFLTYNAYNGYDITPQELAKIASYGKKSFPDFMVRLVNLVKPLKTPKPRRPKKPRKS